MQVRLVSDVRDLSGDTDLFVPAGTVVNVVSDEGDYLIVETESGDVSFPVDADEYAAVG